MTSDESKLRVLVVDDDANWMRDLKRQSKALSSSKLEIEPKNSFDKGLQYLAEEKNVDLVVVDLYLDHEHRAFEFIDRVRELGLRVPFVVVTGTDRENALKEHRKEFDKFVGSNSADFVEKLEVKSFLSFQLKLLDLYLRFRDHTNLLGELLVLASEARSLHRLVSSYAPLVRQDSFPRLCTASDRAMDRIVLLVQDAMDDLRDTSSSKSTVTARKLETARHQSRSQQGTPVPLEERDKIPYCTHRKELLRSIEQLSKALIAPNTGTQELKSLNQKLLDAEQRRGIRFAEIIVLNCAKVLARQGETDRGLELLFELSFSLAERREQRRVLGVDAITAAYLKCVGREELAAQYLATAEKLARTLGEHRFADSIDMLQNSLS